MKQYLYTLEAARYGMLIDPTDDEIQIVPDHQAYLQKLVAEGTVIFAGEVAERSRDHFGLIVFQADDDAAAQAILQQDPAVSHRIMRGCLYPHRISLWNSTAMQLEAEQQHYFYKIRPVRPAMLSDGFTEAEGQAMTEHFQMLQRLTNDGVFAYAGPMLNTDHSNFGAGLLRAASLQAAWDIGNADPAVIARVMRLDIFPFKVKTYNPNYTQ